MFLASGFQLIFYGNLEHLHRKNTSRLHSHHVFAIDLGKGPEYRHLMTIISNILLTALFSLLVNSYAFAQAEEEIPESPTEMSAGEPDLCNQVPEEDELPEKLQSGVHEFSCRTFRWIDSLFGDSVDFDEQAVGGKLSLGMTWNEFEGAKAKARYRVRSDLPNFSSRWGSFFGRVEEDAYISDTETLQESALRDGISSVDEPEWLLGLGYDNRGGTRKGWDYSIGLRLRTPVRVYVKARYRTEVQLGANALLRFRQTLFWRDGTGFGTTTHIDTARNLSSENLLRWELIGTVSESTQGTQWFTGNTWYHRLSGQTGISLLTFARGETDHEVPLHEYGFELTWRRKLSREWLYINVGPTLTWPKLHASQQREPSVGFAVLMDFEFGTIRD